MAPSRRGARASSHLIHGRLDVRPGRQRAVPVAGVKRSEIRSFAGGGLDRDRARIEASEISNGNEQEQDDRQDHREFDDRLTGHGSSAMGAANGEPDKCPSEQVPGPRCPATDRQDGRLTLHRTFRPVLLGQQSVLRCRATTVAGGVLCDLGWKRAVSRTQARCRRCRTSSPDGSSTNRFRNSSLTETQIRSRPLPRLRCRCRRGRRCLPEPPSALPCPLALLGELPSASGLD